jgi:hypothetical protein
MPRGGARPGAGRKPGSRDKTADAKKVLEAHAAIMSQDVRPEIAAMSPLDVMLRAMMLEANNDNWKEAAALARDAAPYLHPRLSSETLNVRNDDSKRSADDLRREIAELDRLAKAGIAPGVVAPGMPSEPDALVH